MRSSSSLNAPAAADRPEPWLYGPMWDALFGYGLAYVVSVPLLLMATLRSGAGAGSLWIATLLALAFSTPHYGATILRVYESRKERRAYAFFTVWMTAVLAALFVLGLHSRWVGSILLTAYVTWGIWHFSAQNYGIAVMYLRRRGLEVAPDVKGPLYASFVFSAALAILAIYVVGSQLSFAAGSQDSSGTFRVLQLGVPQSIRSLLNGAAIAGYLGSLCLVAFRLRARLPLLQLAPLGLLALTQALWFSVPAIGTIAGAWSSQTTGYAFAAIWISTAHAVQYLWISTYYAQRASRCRRLSPYFVKCLLTGAAVTAPGLFLAPGLFGGVAIHGPAIVVLVFAVVNLHHFVLDGAIWKLTDGPVARLLVRSQANAPIVPDLGWRWARPVLLGVGALVMIQQLYGAWAVRLVFTETTPLERQRSAAEDLHWLGLDVPDVWLSLGMRAESEGEAELAIHSYRTAVHMYAQEPPTWALSRLAWLLLEERAADPESVAEATELALYLSEALGNTHPEGYRTLAAAHAAGGRWKKAITAGEWALGLAYSVGDADRARALEHDLSLYRSEAVAQARERRRLRPAQPSASSASPGRTERAL